MVNIALKSMLHGLIIFILIVIALAIYMTWMPNPDTKKDSTTNKQAMSELEERLKAHVTNLSASPTGRNLLNKDNLTPARDYIAAQFSTIGLVVKFHDYTVDDETYSNVIVDMPSQDESSAVLIVGAHYDSVEYSPGANDNASGVAALIELARHLASRPPTPYRIRLIAFVNEEPPFYYTPAMGSVAYTGSLAVSGDDILGMISLETIGYYTDEKDSQFYPWPLNLLYPDTGNFIAFVGNLHSRSLVTAAIARFRSHSSMPAEGLAAPAFIPGVGWSDHWSFWTAGHKAIMITDTALYRYAHYHMDTDTPDKLSYDRYARVVHGLFSMVDDLATTGI